jgi:DNA recombination protein RmuC
MDATTALALLAGLVLGALGAFLAARLGGRSRLEQEARLALEARAADQALVRQGLSSLEEQMRALREQRVSWQAQLQQQVADVRHSTDLLRRETTSLATALRRPDVRGRWGELHLRRAVELAGLVARCDFDEQVTVRSAEGAALRPDLVVHLAGGKQVVVDAKVALDAYLDVTETEDPDERAAHLARHARQFRQHVDTLAAKAYWRALPVTPELVVMFVPGESFLSAALEGDARLLEYAAERKVILATPTTLIALLRTVAHGWTQEALAAKARDIHRLGRELHERLATMNGHLDKVGRSLAAAVSAYNQAVGSLESRVLVSARRLSELEVTSDELPGPQPVEVAPRTPSPSELVEDERSGVRAGGGPPLGVASDPPA